MLATASRSLEVTITNKHPWTDREMQIPVMKVTPQQKRCKLEGHGFESRQLHPPLEVSIADCSHHLCFHHLHYVGVR